MKMITVSEYKAHVQQKKIELLQKIKEANFPKKEIALISYGENWDKFIIKYKELLEEFGATVHWYHYPKEIVEELDMQQEINDLAEHYDIINSFGEGLNVPFAISVYSVLRELGFPFGAQASCVLGNDITLSGFIAQRLLVDHGNKVYGVPFGSDGVYNAIFESDVTYVFDPRFRINCYPISKPLFQLYPWSTTNFEERMVYDISEEVMLKVIEDYVYR